MTEHHPLTAAIRAAAKRSQLRLDGRGRVVSAAQLEAEAAAANDQQPDRVTEGSGDGGRGNDIGERRAQERSTDMNHLIRRYIERGY